MQLYTTIQRKNYIYIYLYIYIYIQINYIDHSCSYESESCSEDEGMEDYKVGGYHPVHIGEIMNGRYVILQKLGWGHFSTVWLSRDMKHKTYVAIKIQKSAQHYSEAAYDEIEILEQISTKWKKPRWKRSLQKYAKNFGNNVENLNSTMDGCYCVQLLNSFVHHGPNGRHLGMVFEIMGVNLLHIIKKYNYRGVI